MVKHLRAVFAMAFNLSESTIRTRLVEWANLKKLHKNARERVGILEERNRALKEENAELAGRLKTAEEEARRREETIEKLQKLLFERHEPRTRMQRPREPKARDAASYRRPAPGNVTERRTLSLRCCPECGGSVSSPQSSRTRLIEDIALCPEPAATEWTITRHWCKSCRKLVEGTVPGVLPRSQLGPGVLTFVTLARLRWNLPFGKIRDVLSLSYGLDVSEGEVAHLLCAAGELAGEKWREITEAVRLGKRVHCDETGWYVNGGKAWAHVFSSEKATLYVMHDTRGKGVAERALGASFEGVRVSDCLPNYKNLPGTHQICWAHLTREACENSDRETNAERQLLSQELDSLYARLRKETADWDEDSARAAKRWCERRLGRLLARCWRDPPSRKLVGRLAHFRSALFTCLDSPGIPPDNNEAERSLRKLAVQRKISGGSRSWKHAAIRARVMSVLETLKKENGDALDGLQALLAAGIEKRLSGG